MNTDKWLNILHLLSKTFAIPIVPVIVCLFVCLFCLFVFLVWFLVFSGGFFWGDDGSVFVLFLFFFGNPFIDPFRNICSHDDAPKSIT